MMETKTRRIMRKILMQGFMFAVDVGAWQSVVVEQ